MQAIEIILGILILITSILVVIMVLLQEGKQQGLSGAIAGLAGVAYYLGYTNAIIPKTLPGMGYDAISVALLGSGSPIGSLFAAVIVSIFQQGANFMSAGVGVAKEIASLLTGSLLLFAPCGNYMKYRAARKMQQAADLRPDSKEVKAQ